MPLDDSITKVVTQLENQLEGHVRATNDKLDILIELTRQMAAMHERQQRHSDDINRIEKNMQDDRNRATTLYDKIDIKLMTAEVDRKASLDRLFTKLEENGKMQSVECDIQQKKLDIQLKELSTAHYTLDTDYKAKKNFTNGVIWILGAAMMVFQGIGYNWVTSQQADFHAVKMQITNMVQVDQENQQQMELLQRQVREMKQR